MIVTQVGSSAALVEWHIFASEESINFVGKNPQVVFQSQVQFLMYYLAWISSSCESIFPFVNTIFA